MRTWVWLLCSAMSLSCGGRPSAWDQPFTPAGTNSGVAPAYGLTDSVAVIDQTLERATLLSAPSALSLSARSLGLGHDLATAQTSADRQTLFALSRGVQPQRNPGDQPAQLMLIDGHTQLGVKQTYVLNTPMDQLALDPQGQWAILYGTSGLVVNLNELQLVDLTQTGAAAITPKTLHGSGGNPKRFTFTDKLNVPGGDPRRLLIIERDSDVVLVDLANPNQNEVIVPLPATDTGGTGSSVQVAYDAAAALIAVRESGSSSVFLLELAAPAQDGQDFSVVTNLVDVGGQPAAIDFAHNDQSVRLVALVGSNAVLVDPATSIAASVKMPAPFTGIRRITAALDPSVAPASGDVALLYSPNSTQIAYFTLGGAPGALYRSIEPYDIGVAVANVIDMPPGSPFSDYKLLETPGQEFYVLNLTKRQSAPMQTSAGLTLNVSPDGKRVWAFQPGDKAFASVDFLTLHPISLVAERTVRDVFDIQAANGDRSAVALHFGDGGNSGIAATVVDAQAPSTGTARFYSGFELGGLQ